MNLYFIHIPGSSREPSLHGPYETEEAREQGIATLGGDPEFDVWIELDQDSAGKLGCDGVNYNRIEELLYETEEEE